jgi:addiction module HigA family antidote
MINGACALCGRREMLVQLKLLITIEEVAMKREIPLIHPGEILLEDFLKPMGITQYRLAKEIGVPQRRIGQICSRQRAITPDTALRLAAFFGTDAQSWVNLQAHYDTEQARVAMEDILANIHKYQPVAAY